MNKDKALDKGRSMYPPETVFISPYSGDKFTVVGNKYTSTTEHCHVDVEEVSQRICLCFSNEWAKIISSPAGTPIKFF